MEHELLGDKTIQVGDRETAEGHRITQYTFFVPLWCLTLMSFASNSCEPELHIKLEGFYEHGVKPTLIGATSPLFRSTRALCLCTDGRVTSI